MKYVYHYCAEENASGGYPRYRADGIAQLLKEVRSFEDYLRLKAIIKKETNMREFAITSLTFLGTTEDE